MPSAMVRADRGMPSSGMLASQMVWPWEPMASRLLISTSFSLQNWIAAAAKVSPRWTFTSESSEADVRSCLMMDRTRFFRSRSMGISPCLRREKCMGESGVS